MIQDYYNNIATYLTDTFGANFIFLTFLLTTVVSIVYFIVITYIITHMDKRYFIRNKNLCKKIVEGEANQESHVRLINSTASFVINAIKVITGLCLLVFGIAMLVLPGQGLITMVIGLSLIPFPGKNKFEQKILSLQSVRTSLNWIRMKANKEPFIFD